MNGEERKTSSYIASHSNRSTMLRIDWERTFKMTLYGMCISAPTYAFWYGWLEKYSQKIFASQPPGTSLALPRWLVRLEGWPFTGAVWRTLRSHEGSTHLRTWKIIGFKLAMDTFVFDPLYLTMFFATTSVMENRATGEIGKKLREDLMATWIVDIAVWTPIQTMNFRWIPVLYQALVVQSCNIGWNAYLSFVQHHK